MSRGVKIFLVVLCALVVGLLISYIATQDNPPREQITDDTEARYRTDIIGRSVEGRDIETNTYGTGKTKVLLVGGVHGGYEWNSVLLSYEIMDYLQDHPETVPANVSVTVVPVANPDGLYQIVGKEGRFSPSDVNEDLSTGTGRFNANDVDLNRNFDCKWQAEAKWRGNDVSAGTAAFSEPEARAIRDYVLTNKPDVVVTYHSQANSVYASECENGILPETLEIMDSYALASGYNPVSTFDSYPVTGDLEGWLASMGIPAITVELSSHQSIEFERNLKGIIMLINQYK